MFEDVSLTYSSWKQKQLGYSWLWGTGLGVTALLTTVTNILVIAAVWKDPNRNLRRSPSNILIASQALADLFVGVAQEPVCIWWFVTFQDDAIAVAEALSSVFMVSSVCHMVSLGYDRYVAVVTPMHYTSRITQKAAYKTIIVIWSYSVVYMGYRTVLRDFFQLPLTVNIISGLHTVFPAFVGVVLYARLYYVIRNYRQRANPLDTSGKAVVQAYRRQRKMTYVLLVAMLLFMFCMTPWFVFYQVIGACPSCEENTELEMYLFCLFYYLFMFKSLLNPFLYAWRLSKYRAAFRCLIPGCRIPRKVGEASDLSHSMQSETNAGGARSVRRTARL